MDSAQFDELALQINARLNELSQRIDENAISIDSKLTGIRNSIIDLDDDKQSMISNINTKYEYLVTGQNNLLKWQKSLEASIAGVELKYERSNVLPESVAALEMLLKDLSHKVLKLEEFGCDVSKRNFERISAPKDFVQRKQFLQGLSDKIDQLRLDFAIFLDCFRVRKVTPLPVEDSVEFLELIYRYKKELALSKEKMLDSLDDSRKSE